MKKRVYLVGRKNSTGLIATNNGNDYPLFDYIIIFSILCTCRCKYDGGGPSLGFDALCSLLSLYSASRSLILLRRADTLSRLSARYQFGFLNRRNRYCFPAEIFEFVPKRLLHSVRYAFEITENVQDTMTIIQIVLVVCLVTETLAIIDYEDVERTVETHCVQHCPLQVIIKLIGSIAKQTIANC